MAAINRVSLNVSQLYNTYESYHTMLNVLNVSNSIAIYLTTFND